ncbi:MAG: hypothetical protein ACOH1J_03295 [Microbacteriaceae bacterium]
MTAQSPLETTLDFIFGRRKSRAATHHAGQLAAADGVHRASLGTAFIGIGASLIVAVRAIYGFAWFVSLWPTYPNPVPALTAWILLIAVLVATFITTRLVSDHLPTWMFATFIVLLSAVIALDLFAVWDLHDIGAHATASLTAAMSLLLIITLRKPRELLITSASFGLALAVAIAINTPLTSQTLPSQITSLGFAVIPVAIGVVVIIGFRRMVKVELDRVLIQSTVSAPRFAVGMLASEELARLDLAAEELLDSVATGRTMLPLNPSTASVAASLATELRLHLIEGRRETWLYHAVTESEMLGRSVTLSDKSSLAGLLDATMRDGLLAALWLLVSDNPKAGATRTIAVTVGPINPSVSVGIGNRLSVPIVIEISGAVKNRIDLSTWDAIRQVGRYTESGHNGNLRVDIECFVENPADQ